MPLSKQFSGRAGTGKTSSMAMLASNWVDEHKETNQCKNGIGQLDFVFFIELRYVNDNSPLAQIIIKQHGMKSKKISESQIRSILEGESERVLLLFDGYDEYKKGTNDDVDAAIEDTIGDCFLILTSRDGDYISKETLDKMDGELELTGFNKASVKECAKKYLGSEDLAEELIKEAEQLRIDDFLQIPIILLMICVLYFKEHTLPSSQTQIVQKILKLCIDRSAIKHFGRSSTDIPWLEDKLFQLGKLAWNALKCGTRPLLILKVNINLS